MQHTARHRDSTVPPGPLCRAWRLRLERLAAAGLAALLVFGGWQLAGSLSERLLRGELQTAAEARQQVASAVSDSIAQSLDGDIAMLRGIPDAVAAIPEVRTALDAELPLRLAALPSSSLETRAALLEGEPRLASLNRLFRQVGAQSGLDLIWLVDRAGNCIVSSNAGEPQSFVGRPFGDRSYMRAVAQGDASIGFARGQITGVPGLYVISPILSEGHVIGAVVGKINLSRATHWVSQPGAFVADQNGVIILAHEASFQWRALPGAAVLRMSEADRLATYPKQTITELKIMPQGAALRARAPWLTHVRAGGLVSIEGAPPALLRIASGAHRSLSTGLAMPFDLWEDAGQNYRRNRMLIFFAGLSALSVCMVLGISYRRERRLHRATRGLAVQLQEANGRLSDEARYDALTGALSRRYFLDRLRDELRAAQTSLRPLTMVIADLDHFKQVNDRHGHATGDRALEYFHAVCERVLRVGDAVGRLGGEEFGILMPGAPAAQAEQLAERIRLDFRRSRPASIPDDIGLSVSIGIAAAQRDDSPERLLSRADQALYLAKARGRNRCMVFDTRTETDAGADHEAGHEANCEAGRGTAVASD